MNRAMTAARLHLIGWQNLITPYAVMASALAINLLVFGLLQSSGAYERDTVFTGGLLSLYGTVTVVFVQAMNRQFSFAVGFGLTRRSYLLGTGIFLIGLALASGVGLYVLRQIEAATGGFGLDLEFFAIGGWYTGDPVTQVIGYAAPMVALCTMGALFGAVFARWGTIGMYSAMLFEVFVVGGFVVIATYADAWTSIGNWFSDQPMVALLAIYPWIIAAVFAAATYAVARRVNA